MDFELLVSGFVCFGGFALCRMLVHAERSVSPSGENCLVTKVAYACIRPSVNDGNGLFIVSGSKRA